MLGTASEIFHSKTWRGCFLPPARPLCHNSHKWKHCPAGPDAPNDPFWALRLSGRSISIPCWLHHRSGSREVLSPWGFFSWISTRRRNIGIIYNNNVDCGASIKLMLRKRFSSLTKLVPKCSYGFYPKQSSRNQMFLTLARVESMLLIWPSCVPLSLSVCED